jgi:hypothetical protein
MSQENVEIVRRAIEALNQRNVDAYLARLTEDAQLQTPLAPVEGTYEGRDAARRYVEDINAAIPDFRLAIDAVEPVGASRVLAFTRATASGRASGISGFVHDLPAATIYDLVDQRIARIQVFLDRQQALKALGLAE